LGERIAQASLIIQTLRDAGYKSTSFAVAELVDNSIEAEAANIAISIQSGEEVVNNTISERIQKIGIFDDGIGMDFDVLSKCLSFGWGTRLNNGTGLGKFGFGLKGASISQARRIEIYSWQKNQTPNFIYLDIDEVKENNLNELPEAISKDIPSNEMHLLKGFKPESGTLIIWSKLDRLNPKRAETLVKHMNGDMCRIFRHFMDDDDTLGKRRNISVSITDPNGDLIENSQVLAANDPTYLLKPNNVPGYENEQTNIINDQVTLKVLDENNNEQEIKFICSIAKPEIQALGGNTPVGRHYGKNNGISFVRHGRELELSYKGFFTQSEARNRWIGLEVQFEPALDRFFNVPNNKQSIRDFRKFEEDELEGLAITASQEKDSFEGRKASMLIELHKIVDRCFKNAESIVKSRGKGNRKKEIAGEEDSTGTRASKKLKEIDINVPTNSEKISATKTPQEKHAELVKLNMESDSNLTLSEATDLAKYQMANLVDIVEKEWPGNTFLDVDYVGAAAVAIVNRKHKFYDIFYDHLMKADDARGYEALKLMLLALTRSEDVMTANGEISEEKFGKLRDTWGKYLKELLPLVQ